MLNIKFAYWLSIVSPRNEYVLSTIIMIAVFLALFTGFIFFINYIRKNKKMFDTAFKNGVPAIAVLVGFENTDDNVGGRFYYKLQYTVKKKDGTEFPIYTGRRFDYDNPPKIGDVIYIEYDPINKSHWDFITKDKYIAAGGELPDITTLQAKF